MQSKLIENYNFFTKENPKSQDDKLLEECIEFDLAYAEYLVEPTKANFIAMLGEELDVLNLLCQKAIVEYGLNMDEIEAMFKLRIDRTSEIIKRMKLTGKSYKEIRREYD